MNILIFLHGTILMHKNAQGKTRHEIIRQVREGEESVRDYAHYVPIGNAAAKLQAWSRQGAVISYLSALTVGKIGRGDESVDEDGLKADGVVLKRYGFPNGDIFHRGLDESYKDVIERMDPLPDILIEDDCDSIGREEMTYPSLRQDLRDHIYHVAVPEFGGIEHLSDDIQKLVYGI